MLLACSKTRLPQKTGGNIAKKARIELEEKTQKKVVSRGNYLPPIISHIIPDQEKDSK